MVRGKDWGFNCYKTKVDIYSRSLLSASQIAFLGCLSASYFGLRDEVRGSEFAWPRCCEEAVVEFYIKFRYRYREFLRQLCPSQKDAMAVKDEQDALRSRT